MLPLITLSIVSTIPLKMAFQNTVGKGENANNNFLHVSECFFFFFCFVFLPFQALSSMLFANIFKLKESKMSGQKKNSCVSGHPTDPTKWPPTEKLSN